MAYYTMCYNGQTLHLSESMQHKSGQEHNAEPSSMECLLHNGTLNPYNTSTTSTQMSDHAGPKVSLIQMSH